MRSNRMSKYGFALTFFALASLIVTLTCLPAIAADGPMRPVNLRCEYRQNPLGIDTLQPRLSWTLEPTDPKVRGQRQTAYQILAAGSEARLRSDQRDLWDTGQVNSDKSIHVPYEGQPLGSGMQVWWKVRVWDEHGKPSAWSEPAFWSVGLLQAGDWKGRWIGLDGGEGKPEQLKEARWVWSAQLGPGTRYFRRTFEIPQDNSVSDALLYLVGSGASTLYINGKEVRSAKGLKDPISQDITQGLHSGANILGVAVSASGDGPSGLIGA